MSKGEDTRRAILRQALELASEVGMESLTIGALAKQAGMSKSGLYAHFESKEDLQCQVLDTTAELFVDAVVAKAIKESRGLSRVQTLFSRWLDWSSAEFSGGCPLIAAATEYDDRSGPVRDRLVTHLRAGIDTIARAAQIAIDEGHFRKDLDIDQFAYDFWAILLAFHHYARLLRADDANAQANRAFDRLIHDAEGN